MSHHLYPRSSEGRCQTHLGYQQHQHLNDPRAHRESRQQQTHQRPSFLYDSQQRQQPPPPSRPLPPRPPSQFCLRTKTPMTTTPRIAESPNANHWEEALFPRSRLGTEETELVRNGVPPCSFQSMSSTSPVDSDEAVPLPISHYDNDDDDNTIISSLSNDDTWGEAQRRWLDPIVESELPKEVTVPCKPSKTIFSAPQVRKPTVYTQGPSPVVPRPTLGRHAPKMDFVPSGVPMGALVVDGHVVEGIRPRDPDPFFQSEQCSLVSGRKRRIHTHQASSATSNVSVGSMVGQSSLFTAPTMISESTYSASSVRQHFMQTKVAEKRMNWVTGAEDGVGCCTQPRRSAVRQEVKYLLDRVSSPLRMIYNRKPSVELQRSSGTLA